MRARSTSGAAAGRSGGARVARIQLRRSEKGQTSSEYAIILGLIAPPIILLFAALSDAIIARIDAVAAFFTS